MVCDIEGTQTGIDQTNGAQPLKKKRIESVIVFSPIYLFILFSYMKKKFNF